MAYHEQKGAFSDDWVQAILQWAGNPAFQDVSEENAWFVYNNTFHLVASGVSVDKQPSQFFGRLLGNGLDEWVQLFARAGARLEPEFIAIGESEKENLRTLDNFVEQKNWNVVVNDCWVLGGVNNCQNFYACSPIIWENILCDKYLVKVTGRELVGLALAGYKEEATPMNGKLYVADMSKENQARNLSLLAYTKKMKSFKNQDAVKNFFIKETNFHVHEA